MNKLVFFVRLCHPRWITSAPAERPVPGASVLAVPQPAPASAGWPASPASLLGPLPASVAAAELDALELAALELAAELPPPDAAVDVDLARRLLLMAAKSGLPLPTSVFCPHATIDVPAAAMTQTTMARQGRTEPRTRLAPPVAPGSARAPRRDSPFSNIRRLHDMSADLDRSKRSARAGRLQLFGAPHFTQSVIFWRSSGEGLAAPLMGIEAPQVPGVERLQRIPDWVTSGVQGCT